MDFSQLNGDLVLRVYMNDIDDYIDENILWIHSSSRAIRV